jgi:hypothetical protein
MLFFCSIDNAAPIRTTLAEQQAAIAPDGTRARQGLCVDAPGPAAAAAVLAAYLLDCIRSGAPTYAPTVAIEDREGVPVATLAEPGPAPTRAEAAALAAMQARAAARAAAHTAPTPRPQHAHTTPTPGPSAPAPALCFTPEPSNDDASQSDMNASGSAPPV